MVYTRFTKKQPLLPYNFRPADRNLILYNNIFSCSCRTTEMRSLEVTATWQEEEEDVEVDDIEIGKHSINGRDDLTESSSDEATGRKIARRKSGGR